MTANIGISSELIARAIGAEKQQLCNLSFNPLSAEAMNIAL